MDQREFLPDLVFIERFFHVGGQLRIIEHLLQLPRCHRAFAVRCIGPPAKIIVNEQFGYVRGLINQAAPHPFLDPHALPAINAQHAPA